MQLVCFAVNYVGSAMAKTRLKTSSASEIGVTGAEAVAVKLLGKIANYAHLLKLQQVWSLEYLSFGNRIFTSLRNLALKSLPRHFNSRGRLGWPKGAADRRRADHLGQRGDADVH